jgi:putative toxin-antitoxin system antitoxin component (TIGR02293 family)
MALAEPSIEDVEISRTVALLGGRRTLHRPVRSRLEAHDLLQKGLPGHALKHLVDYVAMFHTPHHGSLEKAVSISLRTYQRRMDALDKRLSPEQSGRTWEFAEILGRAIALFGSPAKPRTGWNARQWRLSNASRSISCRRKRASTRSKII